MGHRPPLTPTCRRASRTPRPGGREAVPGSKENKENKENMDKLTRFGLVCRVGFGQVPDTLAGQSAAPRATNTAPASPAAARVAANAVVAADSPTASPR
ncbi:hypothetical protein GCM10022232_15320 [Streptomyces plumbiresistens]|uniref:Uncharacterized protein n=1 Tax=Streptomyces plumbiresistens TaxID=511811 RepID=A0ABP7QJQ6_9ACTN